MKFSGCQTGKISSATVRPPTPRVNCGEPSISLAATVHTPCRLLTVAVDIFIENEEKKRN